MKTRLALTIVLTAIAAQAGAHPENERHLVDADLEPIRKSLQSLSERIGVLDELTRETNNGIKAITESLDAHRYSPHALPSHEHEPNVWAKPEVAGAGGAAGGGLTVAGVAWWLFRRYLRKILPDGIDGNGTEPSEGTDFLSLPDTPATTPSSSTTATGTPANTERMRERETPTTETRIVTASRKDEDGNITALCSEDEDWSPRMKDDVVDDINNRGVIYESLGPTSGRRAKVLTRTNQTGWYLTTAPDRATDNNLQNLPDC